MIWCNIISFSGVTLVINTCIINTKTIKLQLLPNKSDMRYTLLLLLNIYIGCFNLTAQQSDEFNQLFDLYRKNKDIQTELAHLYDSNSRNQIFEKCWSYTKSDIETDRYLAYQIIGDISADTSDLRLQRNAIYYLINEGLNDQSTAIISVAIDYLDLVSVDAFDERSKNRFANIIMSSPPHYKQILMLAGKLQMHQLVQHLEHRLFNDSTLNKKDMWAIQLALARMDDPEMVDKCIKQVAHIGINDLVIYQLIPDLLYLKNRQVFDFLLNELSHPNMNCTSADPDNEVTIDCGYRLAELVSPFIIGFPISVSASGDLNCEDYHQALHTIRSWIIENRLDYQTNFPN